MQIGVNATNFLKLAYSLSGSPTVISNYKITDIGTHFVPWDCEKVEELAKGTKISNHE